MIEALCQTVNVYESRAHKCSKICQSLSAISYVWKLVHHVFFRHERKNYLYIGPNAYTWDPKEDPSKYYLDRIQKIGITLGSAMEAIQPEWNDDVL